MPTLPGGQRADGGGGEVMLYQAAVFVIVGAGGLLAVAVVAEKVEAGEAGPGQGGEKFGGRWAGLRQASVQHIRYHQWCGSVIFWYGSGSGDSCLRILLFSSLTFKTTTKNSI